MSEHTPGPWNLQEFDDGWILSGADGIGIETLYKVGEAAHANAVLIAAAPQMWEALNYTRRWLSETGIDSEVHPSVVLKIDAAIAAATGEKQ